MVNVGEYVIYRSDLARVESIEYNTAVVCINEGIHVSVKLNELIKINNAEVILHTTLEPIANLSTILNAISRTLYKLGIPSNLYGYTYLVSIFKHLLVTRHEGKIKAEELYRYVAKDCKTTRTRAERAIRHAVSTSMDRADYEVLVNHILRCSNERKAQPTNSEYIAQVFIYIKSVIEEEHHD